MRRAQNLQCGESLFHTPKNVNSVGRPISGQDQRNIAFAEISARKRVANGTAEAAVNSKKRTGDGKLAFTSIIRPRLLYFEQATVRVKSVVNEANCVKQRATAHDGGPLVKINVRVFKAEKIRIAGKGTEFSLGTVACATVKTAEAE